jgi:hypothetical protein
MEIPVRRLLFAFLLAIVAGVVTSSVSRADGFQVGQFGVQRPSSSVVLSIYDEGPNFSIGSGSSFDQGAVVSGVATPALPVAWVNTPSVAGTDAADTTVSAFRTGEGVASEGGGLSLDEARAAAEARGVDTSGIDLFYESSESMGPGRFGSSSFNLDDSPYVNANGNYEVTLSDLGLTDEQTAAETIAHELGHLEAVGPWDEEGAEAYGMALLQVPPG